MASSLSGGQRSQQNNFRSLTNDTQNCAPASISPEDEVERLNWENDALSLQLEKHKKDEVIRQELVRAEEKLALQRKSRERTSEMEEKTKAINHLLAEELQAVRKLQTTEDELSKTRSELQEFMKIVQMNSHEELKEQNVLLTSHNDELEKRVKVMEEELKKEQERKSAIETEFLVFRLEVDNIIKHKTSELKDVDQELSTQTALLAEAEKRLKIMEKERRKEKEGKLTIETKLSGLQVEMDNIIQSKTNENEVLLKEIEALKAQLAAKKAKRPRSRITRFFRRLFRRQ